MIAERAAQGLPAHESPEWGVIADAFPGRCVADLQHVQGVMLGVGGDFHFERELVRLSRTDVLRIRELVRDQAYAAAAMEFRQATKEELQEISDAEFTMVTPGMRKAVAEVVGSRGDQAAAVRMLAAEYEVRPSVIWTEMSRQRETGCSLEDADALILEIRGGGRADARWPKLAGSAFDSGLLDNTLIDFYLEDGVVDATTAVRLEAMFPGSGVTAEDVAARIKALGKGTTVRSGVGYEVELLIRGQKVQ